jgi:hypothetical protein
MAAAATAVSEYDYSARHFGRSQVTFQSNIVRLQARAHFTDRQLFGQFGSLLV